MFKQLWRDERGAVISLELVMLTTIVGLGAITGYTAVRDAIVTELADVADAIAVLDQSYSISGIQGFSAATAGTEFIDIRDRGDEVGAVGTPRGIIIAANAFADLPPWNEGATGIRGTRP
jgi:Flp pilus assembly pilin Flp